MVERSVPIGTRSAPTAREAMLRIVKCLRALVAHFTSRCGIAAILHGGDSCRFTWAEPMLHEKSFPIERNLCFVKSFAIIRRKGLISVSESKLRDLSMDFAVSIIELVRSLKQQKETIISNQIGRSGTSIGANIREAQYAHGKADFIAKLQIALKEAGETGYWLELLHRTNYLDDAAYQKLNAACTNIRVLLISSLNTAKAKSDSNL